MLLLLTDYRSRLVYALQADDVEALMNCITEYNQLEPCGLLTKQSPIKNINNVLHRLLTTESTKLVPTNFHTLLFVVTARFGRLRVLAKLLGDQFDIDPSALNNYAIQWASQNGHTGVVQLLLNDHRVNPAANKNCAIRWASMLGHVDTVKLLLSDMRVDPSTDNNFALRWANEHGHIEVMKVLLKDPRIDPSVCDQVVLRSALEWANLNVLQLVLADERTVITNRILFDIDAAPSGHKLDVLFAAAGPHFWHRVIRDGAECCKRGHVRNKLNQREMESSWMLLLCVKRRWCPRAAARVGDVLREVCSEWTPYVTMNAST